MLLARLTDGGPALVLDSGTSLLPLAACLSGLRALDASGADRIAGALVRAGDWLALVESWDEVRGTLELLRDRVAAGDDRFSARPLADCSFGPALPSPSVRIFALGGNFGDHLTRASAALRRETRAREIAADRRKIGPWGFHVLADTVVGHGHAITPPRGLTRLDYEGEVAVILRSGGRDILARDVRFWGVTGFNDFSLRDTLFGIGDPYDRGSLSWTLQKNFDTGSSCGPWIAIDEDLDVDALQLTLSVNGEVRQRGSTDQMIFSFAEAVEHLSRFLTLRPGDVIVSGTPAGTAMESGSGGRYLAPGDETALQIEGIGALRNRIASAE